MNVKYHARDGGGRRRRLGLTSFKQTMTPYIGFAEARSRPRGRAGERDDLATRNYVRSRRSST